MNSPYHPFQRSVEINAEELYRERCGWKHLLMYFDTVTIKISALEKGRENCSK